MKVLLYNDVEITSYHLLILKLNKIIKYSEIYYLHVHNYFCSVVGIKKTDDNSLWEFRSLDLVLPMVWADLRLRPCSGQTTQAPGIGTLFNHIDLQGSYLLYTKDCFELKSNQQNIIYSNSFLFIRGIKQYING